MRRGFKSEAERLAEEIRGEVQIGRADPLDPRAVAAHLAIPVVEISELAVRAHQPDLGAYFLVKDPGSFSAMTAYFGRRRIIVCNDRHAATRRASDLAHELAHVLLEHAPAPVASPDGCRLWDPDIEAEATWLGGCLLVPREGALLLRKRGMGVEDLATHFGVSEHLVRWRLQQTGIERQLRRLAE